MALTYVETYTERRLDAVQQVIDEAQGVEFPGMFG